MPAASVHVGSIEVPLVEATRAIRDYTDDSSSFAWPYYDHLDTRTAPTELGDADLLAPTLLNAAPKIVGFAGLQKDAIRTRLEQGLERLSNAPPLVKASDSDIEAVGDLYSVLDDPGVPFIKGTTLSKVLHRKRPGLIPLYDSNVWLAYGTDPVLRRDGPPRGRTWAKFSALLASAMQRDLNRTPRAWADLTALVGDGSLTPVRALDILAWTFAQSRAGPSD